MSMDNEQFQCWLAGIDSLSAAQRREAEAVFSGRTGSGSSLAAVELAVDADRHCRIAASPVRCHGARHGACVVTSARSVGAHSTPLPARPCPGFTTKTDGWPLADAWLREKRFGRQPITVILPSTRHSVGVTGFWRLQRRPRKSSKGSSRSMKPMFWRATRDREPSRCAISAFTASPAKEAARLASAACRANRCRF